MLLSLLPDLPNPGLTFLNKATPRNESHPFQLEVPLNCLLLHLHAWVTPWVRKSAVVLNANIVCRIDTAIHPDLLCVEVPQDKPTPPSQPSCPGTLRHPGFLVICPGPNHFRVTALAAWLKEVGPEAGDVLRLALLELPPEGFTAAQNPGPPLEELHFQLTPAPPQGAPLLRQLGLPRANPFSAA